MKVAVVLAIICAYNLSDVVVRTLETTPTTQIEMGEPSLTLEENVVTENMVSLCLQNNPESGSLDGVKSNLQVKMFSQTVPNTTIFSDATYTIDDVMFFLVVIEVPGYHSVKFKINYNNLNVPTSASLAVKYQTGPIEIQVKPVWHHDKVFSGSVLFPFSDLSIVPDNVTIGISTTQTPHIVTNLVPDLSKRKQRYDNLVYVPISGKYSDCGHSFCYLNVTTGGVSTVGYLRIKSDFRKDNIYVYADSADISSKQSINSFEAPKTVEFTIKISQMLQLRNPIVLFHLNGVEDKRSELATDQTFTNVTYHLNVGELKISIHEKSIITDSHVIQHYTKTFQVTEAVVPDPVIVHDPVIIKALHASVSDESRTAFDFAFAIAGAEQLSVIVKENLWFQFDNITVLDNLDYGSDLFIMRINVATAMPVNDTGYLTIYAGDVWGSSVYQYYYEPAPPITTETPTTTLQPTTQAQAASINITSVDSHGNSYIQGDPLSGYSFLFPVSISCGCDLSVRVIGQGYLNFDSVTLASNVAVDDDLFVMVIEVVSNYSVYGNGVLSITAVTSLMAETFHYNYTGYTPTPPPTTLSTQMTTAVTTYANTDLETTQQSPTEASDDKIGKELYCDVVLNVCYFMITMSEDESPCHVQLSNHDDLFSIDCTSGNILNCTDTEIFFSVPIETEDESVMFTCSHVSANVNPVLNSANNVLVTDIKTNFNNGTLSITYDSHGSSVNSTMVVLIDGKSNVFFKTSALYGSSGIVLNIPLPEDFTLKLVFINQQSFMATTRSVTLVQIIVKTTKKFHVDADTSIFDSLFNVSFEARFNVQPYITYVYQWSIIENITNGRNIEATTETQFLALKLTKNICYEVSVIVSSLSAFTASDTTTFCLKRGINITYDVNNAQQYNTSSIFHIDITDIGSQSCVFLDVSDPQFDTQYGFYSMEENLIEVMSRCSAKAPSLRTINWISLESLSAEKNIRHKYANIGSYNATFLAVNPIHHQQVFTSIAVKDIACESPDVQLFGIGISESLPVIIGQSKRHLVESVKKIKCISAVSSTSWMIYIGRLYDQQFLSTALITNDITTLNIPANTLHYGMHKICAVVKMAIDPSFYRNACGYINIAPTPLRAVIFGGMEIIKSYKFDYYIDAGESRDPDTRNKIGMEFYYLCRTIDDPPFNLSRRSILTLPYSFPHMMNPNDPSFVSKGGCFGTGPGRLFTKTHATRFLLKRVDMIINQLVEITLVVYKDGKMPRLSYFQQTLTLVDGNRPSVSVNCVRNCLDVVNHNEEHVLHGGCGDIMECKGKITYEWSLFICNKTKEKFDCADVPKQEFDKISTGEPGSLYFGTNPRTYKTDQWYKISLRGYRSHSVYGESQVTFYVNSPPKNGHCNVSPDEGLVLNETFHISCHDWKDIHQPLRYQYFTKIKGLPLVLYDGERNEYDVGPPLGDMKNNYELTIFMVVSDQFNSKVTLNKTIRVFSFENTSSAVLMVTESLASNNSLIREYAKSGDTSLLSNMVMTYSSVINDNSANHMVDGNLTMNELEERRRDEHNLIKVRDDMINIVDGVKVASVKDVLLVAGSLAAVAEYPHEISYGSQTKLVGKSEEFMDMLDSDTDVDMDGLMIGLSGIVEVTGKVLEVSGMSVDVTSPNNTRLDAISSINDASENTTKQSMEQVDQTNAILLKAQNILSKNVFPGGEPKRVQSETVNLAVGKVLTSKNSSHVLVDGVGANINTSFFAPSSDDDVVLQNDYLSVKVKNVKSNFHTSDESAKNVKSQITGVSFDAMDGNQMTIQDSPEPIALTIKNNPPATLTENVTMNVLEDNTQWSYHILHLNNESLRAYINPENTSLYLFVYLRKDERPTPDVYDYKWKLPDNSSCTWNDGDMNDPIDIILDNPADYHCDRNVHVAFLSDTEQLHGKYVLGIYYPGYSNGYEEKSATDTPKVRKRRDTIDPSEVDSEFCVVIPPPPPTPPPADPPGKWVNVLPVPSNDSIEYGISITTAKCMFWNTTTLSWSTNGCYVGQDTTPEVTQCLCNHLTDFGGDVLVAPNPIDFDKVFEGLKNLGDNLGVLLVILTIVLVYVLLLVWARKKDKKDEAERGIVTIDCRRGKETGYSYIATIVTGAGRTAGTTAKVYIVLSGKNCDSRIIPLKVEGRTLFQARTTTTFKIIIPTYLGELQFIRIFHDNSGPSPSWYLRNIVMTDVKTKQQVPFVCDSWLAVESIDGQIEKLLPVASDKELSSFHIVFATTTAKGLLDGHIWFSVFTRPQQSTFTRVQRLSCCLALIFLTMITNAMFFGVGDVPGAKKTIRLGNVVIDLTGIIIGIQSSFIVLPPSIIVIEIFRRLKPKPKKRVSKSTSAEEFIDNDQLGQYEDEMLSIEVQSNTENTPAAKKKQPFLFPYRFKYIAYVIVFLSSFGSALFTFFYSMMWGPEKSNEFLASMFTGFFQSVLVIQPIKAVVMAMLFALILRKPVEQEHEDVDDEDKSVQEDKLEDLDGDDDVITADEIPIIRPSESAIERARKTKLKERITWEVIKEIVIYLVFLLIVSRLAYAEKDPNMFLFRKDLKNMFDEGKHAEGLELSLVSNPALLYSWLRDTVIPGLFAGPWYNDDAQKDFGFIETRESLRISIPRLRQLRVKQMSCIITDDVSAIITHCEAPYSFSNEEEGTYGVAWSVLNHTNSRRRRSSWIVDKTGNEEDFDTRIRRSTDTNYQAMLPGNVGSLRRRKSRKQVGNGDVYYVTPEALFSDGTVVSCLDRWEHFSASELNGFPFFGRLATYSGGGYVANLGYNEQTGWTVVADLHAHNWLDKQTRAVFVEFTVYNANVNLFAAAFLYIEVLPTGGAFPFADFKVFNGYRYALNSNTASRFTELAFIIFIIYFFVLEIKKMIKQKLEYFKGFFNLLEFILLPLYVFMFGLMIFRWLSTARNIREFKENPKDFVSFQYSAEADSMLHGVIGVIAFILNLKFLKCFQFSKSFYHIAMVMKTFYLPLISFGFVYGIMFFMFAQSSQLSFGSKSENYKTLVHAFVSQFLHLLGTTDYVNIRDSHAILGPLYYVSYSLFMLFIMFNVFMAIICEAIDDDFEEEFLKNIGDIQIAEFLMTKFKNMIGGSAYSDGLLADEDVDDGHKLYKQTDAKMLTLEIAVQRLYERFHEDVECFREDEEIDLEQNEDEVKEMETNEGSEKEMTPVKQFNASSPSFGRLENVQL